MIGLVSLLQLYWSILLSSGWYVLVSPVFGMVGERIGPRWVLPSGVFVTSGGLVIVALSLNLSFQLLAQVIIDLGLGAKFGYVFPWQEKQPLLVIPVVKSETRLCSQSVKTVGGAQATELGFNTATLLLSGLSGLGAVLYQCLARNDLEHLSLTLGRVVIAISNGSKYTICHDLVDKFGGTVGSSE